MLQYHTTQAVSSSTAFLLLPYYRLVRDHAGASSMPHCLRVVHYDSWPVFHIVLRRLRCMS